ncbi:MAG: alpha/beta hydrolase [Desulfobacteraceae bacterium]|jgi:pimeloyl-ACP methyl ester carboxylesterase|nr:MAG: alpha/beta hydrolase [Desulfobacteraceae bacterium]
MEKQKLIMIPGLICDAGLWEHQSRYLSDVADIIIADVTGFDSIKGMAEAILKTAPETFSLAGLSMGGYVSLEIIRQAPSRVKKLALLDTSSRADTAEQTNRRRHYLELVSNGRFEEVVSTILSLVIHPDRRQDEKLCSNIMQMKMRVGPMVFTRQQSAIMGRQDSRKDLSKTRCPTLVLCGRQDVLTPLEVHEEMACMIPKARLAVIEDCGHMSTMERPQAVTALLRDWLIYY